jgi:hypothetical protein
MKTELDIADYQSWHLENLQYQSGLLTLTVGMSVNKSGQNIPKRFLVIFTDARFFEIYDELEHLKNHHESREQGIIGLHSESLLLKYINESTLVISSNPGEFSHYSVMTSNEFVHVITREIPKIYKAS